MGSKRLAWLLSLTCWLGLGEMMWMHTSGAWLALLSKPHFSKIPRPYIIRIKAGKHTGALSHAENSWGLVFE